jgi:hypothetical protein
MPWYLFEDCSGDHHHYDWLRNRYSASFRRLVANKPDACNANLSVPFTSIARQVNSPMMRDAPPHQRKNERT